MVSSLSLHLRGNESKLNNKYLSICFVQQDFQKAENISERKLFSSDKGKEQLTGHDHFGKHYVSPGGESW